MLNAADSTSSNQIIRKRDKGSKQLLARFSFANPVKEIAHPVI